jgi:hypothetical protein
MAVLLDWMKHETHLESNLCFCTSMVENDLFLESPSWLVGNPDLLVGNPNLLVGNRHLLVGNHNLLVEIVICRSEIILV